MLRFALLLPLPLLAYVDLGMMGKSYTPSEPDILTRFEQKIASIDTKKLRQRAIEQIEAAKTAEADVPRCMQSRSYDRPYEVTLRQDIHSETGEILHRRGETVPMTSRYKATLCIVDAATPEALEASARSVTQSGKCDKTLVAGGSIDLAQGMGGLGGVYPYSAVLADALGVECYPAKVTIEGNKLHFEEYWEAAR